MSKFLAVLNGVTLSILVVVAFRTIYVVTECQDRLTSLERKVKYVPRTKTWITRVQQWSGDRLK